MEKSFCHKITEILPGLLLGGVRDAERMVQLGATVLVPLDHLDGDIWHTGFRGQILYCPIPDYGILPDDVLHCLTDEICTILDAGKRVGLFCTGGHGRTGYVAACVLARRGIENPIAFLHKNYCPFAVETEEQIEAIIRFIHIQQQDDRFGKCCF